MMHGNYDQIHTHMDDRALLQVKNNWGYFVGLGVALLITGSLATMFAYTATMATMVYLGFFMMIAGFFEGVKAFKLHKWSGFFMHMFLAVLYTIVGIFVVSNPAENALSFTLLMALLFIVSGIMRMIFAFDRHVLHPWWLFFNGLITLL